jgi:hypothetical protein
MHTIDHLSSAALLATLAGLEPRRWLLFVATSTLVDLDHYPGAARRYGLRNPLDGARYALAGRVPGWQPNDRRYPLRVGRPLHGPQTVVGGLVLALLLRPARLIVVAVLWHLLLDLIHKLTFRESG